MLRGRVVRWDPARWRCARGQTVALVLPMLFTLVLFVAVVANVGQAVNRRIALQLVADAGAYTGGSAMATGMNHLAYWNRQIQRMYVFVSDISFRFNFSGCISGYAATGLYYSASSIFQGTNVRFGGLARSEATRVSNYNLADLFPGETGFQFRESDPAVGIPRTRVPGVLVGLTPVPHRARPNRRRHEWARETFYDSIPAAGIWGVPRYRGGSRSWTCWVEGTFFPPVFSTVRFFVTPWWRLLRLPGLPYMFVWEVVAPPTKALMFDDFFGPNAIPEMKAVAVSHPVGGHLEGGLSRYVNRFVPVGRLNGGSIFDPLFGTRRVTH